MDKRPKIPISKIIKSFLGWEDAKMQNIYELLTFVKQNELYPTFYNIETAGTEPEVVINGRKCFMFSSNNYLGLSMHPRVIEKAKEYLNLHGLGPGGSRFLCGNVSVLEELDQKVANLVGTEDAVTFPTGYMANMGIFEALMDPFMGYFPYRKGTGVIFSDEFNHGSVVDGCRISDAKKVIFQHNNLTDLEQKISRVPLRHHKMIVTEGAYSLEGEITALPRFVDIAKKYNAILMVDDAHGVGVLGERGGGAVERFSLQGQVDIIMGSFDKALGGMGGFLAGNKKLMEYLRIAARPYIFSSAVPGVMAGAMIEAINLCMHGQALRSKLFENYHYISSRLKSIGFKVLGSGDFPVAPVVIGNENVALQFAERLFDLGIYAPPFRWPAVPQGASRMRVTVMSNHTRAHLDGLLEAFERVGRQFQVIK